MAAGNATRLIDRVLKSEGGFTNDKRDPGNWTGGKVGKGKLLGTNMGIAANSYPNEDIPNLTKARARFLYKRDYWDKLRGDDLPEGLDYAAFDYAINSGVARPAKALQRIVGANRLDNVIGDATLKLICERAFVGDGTATLINQLCDERLSFMKSLKTWSTFGKGWSKRVSEVRRTSLAMAAGQKARAKVEVSNPERNDKALPTDKSLAPHKTKEGAAVTTTSVGTTGAGGVEVAEKIAEKVSDTQAAIEPITYWLDWAQYVFIGLMVIGAGLGLYIAVKKMRED